MANGLSPFEPNSNATLGDGIDKGVKLYMKLNADKLPKGVNVELIVRDDGGTNPDKAKQLAQELIVRDKDREQTVLQEGDAVEIVTPRQGG